MSRARLAFGLLLVGAGGWFLAAIFAPGPPPAEPRTFTSSAQCRECHVQQYDEWSSSQHAKSWTNPAVRALSNDFANTDCIDCHAPRPVFETGIGARVLPRASRRVEGVDCIACHVLPPAPGETGERVAGTIEAPAAPCRPVERRELAAPEFCSGCHDQHETVRQWRASQWPERGMDCLDCHAPERADGSGRSHAFHGGDTLAMLQSAIALRGAREGAGWTIEVENVGAGHSFPTDERSRAADVFWRPLASDAEPGAWRQLHRFRSPYRHEVDLVDTLLQAHETRRIPLADEDARGAVEVALFYKRSPYWLDMEAPDPEREAVLVQRIELRP